MGLICDIFKHKRIIPNHAEVTPEFCGKRPITLMCNRKYFFYKHTYYFLASFLIILNSMSQLDAANSKFATLAIKC